MNNKFKLILLLLAVTFNTGCVMHSTKSTEVGVRTRKIAFWGSRGVEQHVYKPASTYFFLPIINDWNTFDTKLQNIEMTFDIDRGDIRGRDDLLFKTIDGNDISLDVIISYRILPEKAPYILQFIAKDDLDLRRNIVRVISRSLSRDIFGELSTENFYTAKLRSEKAEQAKNKINEILNSYGVVVERVLTKDYRFNNAYQKAIEDKKIADQQAEKNKSENKAKVEEYRRKWEDAQADVNRVIAKVDGEFQQAKIKADAEYESQKLLAQAILAEGEAEAKGISKMNQALAGTGGKIMVKLKMAEYLQGKKILLIPSAGGSAGSMNLQTTNVNKLLETYGVKNIANQN